MEHRAKLVGWMDGWIETLSLVLDYITYALGEESNEPPTDSDRSPPLLWFKCVLRFLSLRLYPRVLVARSRVVLLSLEVVADLVFSKV